MIKLLFASLMFLLIVPVTAAPASVVATIKPLQLISAAITEGVSESLLILDNGQDPHEIVLRPSDRRKLASADLVLWVGPALEFPMSEMINALDARVLTTQTMPGINLQMLGDAVDPHLWLSVNNAERIARILTETLGELDPEHAVDYNRNLLEFEAAMAHLKSDIAMILARSEIQGWGVYHHAFQYLEADLALPEPLSITDANNSLPGIQGLFRLREQIKLAGLTCLLVEPGTDARKVRSMLDFPTMIIREADIMGKAVNVSAAGYMQLYSGIVEDIIKCSEGRTNDN